MKTTPKSLRLQIGLFGRTNVGKSSFLNLVAGQDVSIISSVPGTTTDVVEKSMELLPVGPVVFLDTAGIDDDSVLAEKRIEKTKKIFDRADVIVLFVEPNIWDVFEEEISQEANKRNIPVIIVVNKIDLCEPTLEFLSSINNKFEHVLLCSSIDLENRDKYVHAFKAHIMSVCPDDFLNPSPLIGDLLPKGGIAVFIIPIDKEAPKGRIILPQVQAMRDILDNGQSVVVCRETEYIDTLNKLSGPPDLVVCDSQVVDKMVAETPDGVKCTTFSILLARLKGDLTELVKGIAAIQSLNEDDKVLIAESCSHHAIEDDIGRIKIPKWLKKYKGFDVKWDVCSGRDYPEDLSTYKLIIHCGGCMLTRREMLTRIEKAGEQGVFVTNYGICISMMHGVIERVLEPFPDALKAFIETKAELSGGVECLKKL
ncbi:MAG: [FeFe] hydrogenase H-cluster maturation GTPase HydF [Candidatus Omnitrophica bacterium]|nr:[FeFe] hydrogenase H-cluster maturation GTPase HydF [Candidatus Omnitrophota bacterium]MBU1996036.1 [FeFe] hydrogenase H-cluster maturation GTPase HydF [Candidatus Omnitrophota bacterium]MBU4333035.1 [FeFe] hydrogenase H-cluster maturation GTPase HydF [Candidatus Omnitrophota bacterium]